MRRKTIGWIVAVSVMLVAAGSLGLGIAAAGNRSGSTAKPAPKGVPTDAFVMSAVVGSDGSLARSSTTGISSGKAGSPGSYEVIFPINVRPCTYVATIGKTNYQGVAKPGFITTVGRFGEPTGVFVATYDKQGQGAKRPFHLVVSCPQPA
jgi:hypothetical protein